MTATYPAFELAAIRQDTPRRAEFHMLLLVCWLLSLACFSAPGRTGPTELSGLDWIAFTKLAVRMVSIGLLALVLLRMNRDRHLARVLACLLPLGLFAAWALASTLWSPMKALSGGHGVELVLLWMLTVSAAALVTSERQLSALLLHFSVANVLIVAAALCLDIEAVVAGRRPAGYLHPNELAASAGVGLVVVVGARLLFRWRWSGVLLPGLLPVYAIALLGARSRTALGITGLVVAGLLLLLRRRTVLPAALAAAGVLFACLPYIESLAKAPDAMATFLLRGQTWDDIAEFSGRDEMWSIALDSFLEAPLFGHGYYSVTSTGEFHVWRSQQYQTAHNLYLHVLTGTGLIGGVLFVWGFGKLLAPLVRTLGRRPYPPFHFLVLALGCWFLLHGMFEISILGPFGPGTVLFFATLGSVAGQLPAEGAR